MNKVFDEEIKRCKLLIKKSYEDFSIVRYATRFRKYSVKTDRGLDFTNIYLRHRVPKLWFTDPAHVPDVFCSQLGRHVAIGEERFLVKNLLEETVTPSTFEFQVDVLKKLVRDFIGEGHSNSVVFAPIKYFTPLAVDGTVTFGWPHYLLLDGRKIPLFYSSKYVKFDKFIIVDKSFGIWIYKKGNVNDFLTIEVRPIDDDPEHIDILVVTKVFYKKENPSAIRIMAPA